MEFFGLKIKTAVMFVALVLATAVFWGPILAIEMQSSNYTIQSVGVFYVCFILHKFNCVFDYCYFTLSCDSCTRK